MNCTECAIDAIHSWFYKPINCSKEKTRLVILTTIVLAALVLATLCYYYGGGVKGYTEATAQYYAYGLWSLAGITVASTLIAYLIRSILAPKQQTIQGQPQQTQPEQNRQAELQQRARMEQARIWHTIWRKFFPNIEILTLPGFQPNLIGPTGYCDDKQGVLHAYFNENNVNTLRALQNGSPFLAVRLRIDKPSQPPVSQILLISPYRNGYWYVSPVIPINEWYIRESIYETIEDNNEKSRQFVDWLARILNGETLPLLKSNDQTGLFDTTNPNGATASLWPLIQI